MELSEIYEPVAAELTEVEKEMRVQMREMYERHGQGRDDQGFLQRIASHVFQVPGKRLRPALVLLSARASAFPTSSDECALVRLAVAVEFIHTASLVHDDIIDHSSYRRAQPTLNETFDNKYAVLAGDILYSQFFSLLVSLPIDADRYRRLLEIFCAVTREMCQGEILEHRMKSSPSLTSYDSYLEMIRSKTASLMSACCQSGSIIAGADRGIEGMLKEYGLFLGLSYQLVDDLLDGDFPVEAGSNTVQRVNECTLRAREAISGLGESSYRRKLLEMSEYVSGMIPTKR
jgi:geranylgeranyl pyrophosphate synthase